MSIIISLCGLLLLSYLFDLSAAKTRIPTVILLIALGWGVKQASIFFNFQGHNLSPILPLLGTVGLVLIVLEGSLELEINASKLPLVAKSSLIALIPMLLMSFGLGWAFDYFGHTGFKIGLVNAIPFTVISSAIAIPSARNLISEEKEFVTYESSLSDIFGVILFNFIALNEEFNAASYGEFFFELFLILIISLLSTLLLSYLLGKIKHHVKFVPIMLMVVLIYAISKTYHLPSLIFILLFGLFLGNIDELKHLKFIQKFHTDNLQHEVNKFQELITEITFMIRSLFFLLFGFLIESAELLNLSTISWAMGIVAAIFLLRFISLKLFGYSVRPLIFLAPRGLITILLFLSIPATQVASLANRSLIIQVIILCALIMMIGLMFQKPVIDPAPESDIQPE